MFIALLSAPTSKLIMNTLYGLNNCDTCKKARNWLQRFDVEFQFIDYREHRIEASTLKQWSAQMGGWDALLNKASTTWRQLPETRKKPGSDPEWQLLLKEYPALIKRPVLVTSDQVVSVGFTDNSYKLRFSIKK